MRTLAVTVLITLFSPLIFASETKPAPLKEIDLVTMEIPPFMSEHMPDQGAGSYALKMLLKKHGYNVTFSFAPFLRKL